MDAFHTNVSIFIQTESRAIVSPLSTNFAKNIKFQDTKRKRQKKIEGIPTLSGSVVSTNITFYTSLIPHISNMPSSSTRTTKDLKMPTTKDGSKDKRYATAQFVKKDGTRDMRTTLTAARK